MKQHPLLFFFLMAFSFSWIALIPGILSAWGILNWDYRIFSIISSFGGPALAGIIMTYVIEGKAGLTHLRQRLQQRHIGWKWYVIILLVVQVLVLLGTVIQPGILASFQNPTWSLFIAFPVYFIIIYFGVSMPEEIGWRGFALPRMQSNYGSLKASLVLGVLWAFWHLPRFLAPDQGGGPGTSFFNFLINFSIFFVLAMTLSLIFTWVFNHTKGSLFAANLLHASIDVPELTWMPLFLALNKTSIDLSFLIAFGMPAILILFLSHGQLGYKIKTDPVS